MLEENKKLSQYIKVEFIGKNLEKNDCAIVATFNALQWSGRKADYKTIRKVAYKKCGWRKNYGIKSKKINDLLKSFDIPVKKIAAGSTLGNFINEVANGKAILIGYSPKDQGIGHIALLTPNFKLINAESSMPTWNDLYNEIVTGKLNFYGWVLKGK